METIATALKALGHPERLRILALLSRGELTVSELVQILGFSQPRITQYIKSLEAAGILERLKEGSWVFSRLRRGNVGISALVATTLNALPQDDITLMADIRRLEDVRAARAKQAEAFFANVANDHGQLGDEYLPQSVIETTMRDMVGEGPFEYMVDLGTGTGRLLEVFADRITRGSGIDNSSDMLKVARHKLANSDYDHINVRIGDLNATPIKAGVADFVTLHQVLHYLDDPIEALHEAARLLAKGGKLLIVDFETHSQEFFRSEYTHRRLGFSDQDITDWMQGAGLELLSVKQIENKEGRPSVKLWLAHKTRQQGVSQWQSR